MADQLAPQFTGTYGHPVVRTPHLDALAARGARFDTAYCNSPLCAPSRFSFMAGKLISKIAAWDNAAEFPASVPTLAHQLGRMGYRTCLAGKMHFVGPDQLHGFSDRVTTDIYPSDFAWTPDWDRNDQRFDKWYHNMSTVKESGTAQTTFQIDYDEEVAFAARRKLFDYVRDQAHPWCMVASFIHPHDPYVARPEWFNLYEDSEIDMPKTPAPVGGWQGYEARLADGIEASTVPLSEDEVRRARRAYYANVSYFDSKIGELVRTVEETGQLENTVIIVTSDHGDMLGEQGLWYKMSMRDYSARVPLVVAGPGITHAEVPNVCSLIDLMPTLMDIAGADWPELGLDIDGRSLWPLLTGADDDSSEAICEYCAEMAGDPILMIRRGDWKYVHCDRDPPQLFNLARDPEELANKAGDPNHAKLVEDFAQEVRSRWLLSELKDKITASQRQRHALNEAMTANSAAHWDYNPPSDASQQYVRNHMDWTVAAARNRFPPPDATK